jgi:LAS superfamily LD-carboxypeptidase LdcB
MAEESKEVLQDVPVSSSVPATMSTVKSVAADSRDAALVSVNAKLPKKINGPVALPNLVEVTKTGYTTGPSSAKPVLLCVIGNHLIEKNTAYDFVMMATLAAQQGISLFISEAFRTNERQEELYAARQNPAAAKELGVAARPGFSNHQGGIALDIRVGISKPQWVSGIRNSPIFDWLTAHAADFGFNHEEGAKVKEPWHWVHPKKEVTGIAAFQQATGYPVLTAETALAAAALNQSGVTRLAYLGIHDKTVGVSRSIGMQQCTRQSCLAESSLFSANQSNGLSYVVSQVEEAAASTSTLESEPKAFDQGTLRPFSYDFATGKWDDGKEV